jgi:Activator of Hsp90 ATPase homolog 1-like protein
MTVTDTTTLDNLTLSVTQEIHIRSSLNASFAALLDQMGPANETPDGKPLPMKIEPWPGGRWFRDLGGDNGHFWGHVQAIKKPTLLEITGPLFLSYPVVSNLQYRLTEVEGGTLLTLRHTALGFVPDEYREGLAHGWTSLLERIRRRAEAA